MLFTLSILGGLGVAVIMPPRPPNGTYVYRMSQAGATIGQSTITISSTPETVTVSENGSVTGVTATTRTAYDPQSLGETSYTADFKLPGGSQHTDVRVQGGVVHVTVPHQSVDITADPSAPIPIITDNFIGTQLFIPAIVHASNTKALTLAVLAGGKAVVATVSPAATLRPAGIPTADSEMKLQIGALEERYWYDPQTFVVEAIEIPSQGIMIRLISSSARISAVGTPAPLPTALPTPTPHFRSVDVTFTSSDGTKLAGTMTIPNGRARRLAAIVLVHGSGPIDRNETIGPNPVFLQLSNALSNAGYVVLRYDKRGVGSSGRGRAPVTRTLLIDDADAAFRFVRAQSYVNPKRVYALGHSEGGELVPALALREPQLAGIILMATPAVPLWQVSMEQVLESVPPGTDRSAVRNDELRALQRLRASKAPKDAWYRSSMDLDPAVQIRRVRCPILILQGADDVQVLAKDLPRLVAAAKSGNRNVSVHVFPRDNHLLMPLTPNEPRTPQAAVTQYMTVPAYVDPRVLSALVSWLSSQSRE